jgi:hypothetical protein
MKWLREHWLPLALVAAWAVTFLYAAWCDGLFVWHSPAQPSVRAELANERIPQIEAKAKTTRRAARAKVDQEVSDAARASDLVDYLGSR